MRIAVLHPGEMGSAVASALAPGITAVWCAAGRSPATRRRAEDAGLEELADLEEVAGRADAVLSVCPPAAALDLAGEVMAAGYRGLYVDANAVAPATARSIAEVVEDAGCAAVDGGIVGPAPRRAGTTRLHLSGDRADEVAGWFAGGPLQTRIVAGGIGAASGLKAAYAGWTKGSAALLTAMRAYARAHGVEEALLEEWDTSQPGLRERSEGGLPRMLATAWRFDGEMREIAAAMAEHDLPPGFHEAAAETYRRLAAAARRAEGDETGVAATLDRLLDS